MPGRNSRWNTESLIEAVAGRLLYQGLTLTERRMIWEQGPGQELRENTAAICLAGFALGLILLSMTGPVLQWICDVSF